jgi:hypothetical protein
MFKFAAKASVALSSTLLASFAFAQSGPPSATLVPLDHSRYDIDKKVLEDRSRVLHRATRNAFDREVYKVPTRPEFVFVTNETMTVTSRPVEQKDWAIVERQAVAPTTPWAYRAK